MWTDIVDLRDFYLSPLGQVARRMIRRRLRIMWPDVTGQAVLGLGFATPYLRPFRDEAARVLAVMPGAQGVLNWPEEGPGLVTLADETILPFADNSIDRVLLVHALESSEQLRAMLREVWRILNGSGRLLVIAPNRRGIWARLDSTPFGNGHPYTSAQLSRLLRDTMFTPERSATALFAPPFSSRMILSSALAWEQVGENWCKTFAGVVITEASKEIYAAATYQVREPRLATLPEDAARS